MNGNFPAIFPNHTIIITTKPEAYIFSVTSVNKFCSLSTMPTPPNNIIIIQKINVFFTVLFLGLSSGKLVKNVLFFRRKVAAPSKKVKTKMLLITLF